MTTHVKSMSVKLALKENVLSVTKVIILTKLDSVSAAKAKMKRRKEAGTVQENALDPRDS